MNKFLVYFLVYFLIIFFTGTAQATMLTNGDFEAPASGYGSTFTRTWDQSGWNIWDTLPGWSTLSGPGIEVEKSGVVTTSQSRGHHVELDSHGGHNTNSAMYQTLYLTKGNYDLSFWYFARTNNARDDNGIFAGIADATDPFSYTGFYDTVSKTRKMAGNKWEEINWSFAITDAADYNLTFGAFGLDNSLGGLIDNVSLNRAANPVPEPATAFLFGLGLLGLTGIARKR